MPTPAQLRAGNYRKQHIRFQGLEISIENPAGSVRSGVDPGGKPWSIRMRHAYGYLLGSRGVDKDHVDCYVGPDAGAPTAYVVHQRKAGAWDRFDEDKVMLGFASQQEATRAYLAHYDDPRFLGPVTAMPMDEFKAKITDPGRHGADVEKLGTVFSAYLGGSPADRILRAISLISPTRAAGTTRHTRRSPCSAIRSRHRCCRRAAVAAPPVLPLAMCQ